MYLKKKESIAIEKAEKVKEQHILARLGDFGQHLVYIRGSKTWKDPR